MFSLWRNMPKKNLYYNSRVLSFLKYKDIYKRQMTKHQNNAKRINSMPSEEIVNINEGENQK